MRKFEFNMHVYHTCIALKYKHKPKVFKLFTDCSLLFPFACKALLLLYISHKKHIQDILCDLKVF